MDEQDMITAFANEPGPTIDLVVERPLEAQDRDGLDRGISREAMVALNNQMIGWVGTRLMRFHDEFGLAAQHVTVTVTVAMKP